MGIGRSAKILEDDGKLHYAVVEGVELHGEEGNKAGLERAPEKKKSIGKDVRAGKHITTYPRYFLLLRVEKKTIEILQADHYYILQEILR